MNNMNIEQKILSPEAIILNPGESLDNNNAHIMVDAIAKAQASGYKYIIIDMARLGFISSAGVGSILGTVEESREKGGDIILCNVSETIRQILTVLDLTDYLTIRINENAARELAGV
jgi:anti-anti-sigma factor